MAKGSKYSRKHQVEQPIEKKQTKQIPNRKYAFLHIIYDDVSFLENFNELNADDQLKIYLTLKNLSESNTKGAGQIERELIHGASYKLNQIIDNAGLKKTEMLRYPLSQDEHHIIRMDFYGTVDKRPTHQLSNCYKSMANKKMEFSLPPRAYRLEDLNAAPAWQIFRQFQSFRKITHKLKKFLSDNRYNPEILKIMGVKDFSDLIFQTFKTDDKQNKVSFVNGDNYRAAFVKALAKQHGKQIRAILQAQGRDDRYISSLLHAMELYGVSNTHKITILEQKFNKRILKDLKKAKIPVEDYNVGDSIPVGLIDYLSDNDKLDLIAARDEDGAPLKGDDAFEVHHKVAVSESGKLPCLAAVNYENNFLLVGSNIHSDVLHLFDKLTTSNGKEAYRCRIEFKNPHIAFMNGLSPDLQFAVDWSKNLEYQKRVDEDKKHIISYDKVMSVLDKNRLEMYPPIKKSKQKFNINEAVDMVRQQFVLGKKNNKNSRS